VQGMGIVRTRGHGGHGATGRDPLNWEATDAMCENDGAMMRDNVERWNGWRGRGGQSVTELPNQTT
jgi:hypothetical protein